MTTKSAFVSTVNPDRTIVLPDAIPVGAKVAVVVLTSEELDEEETARNLRFEIVMDSIRTAINSGFEPPEISDKELKKLINEARNAARV